MPRLGAESFGGEQWKQVGDIANAGRSLSNAMFEKSQELSTTEARQTINQLLPSLDADFNASKEKYQGLSATKEGFAAFSDSFKSQTEKAVKGLSPYAKKLVLSDIDSKKASYAMQWNDYSTSELKKAKDNSLAVENNRFSNDIANGQRTDDNGMDKAVYIAQNIRALHPGQSPEFYQSETNKQIGEAIYGRSIVLSQTSATEALKYLNENRKDLELYDPVKTAELDGKLRESAVKEQVNIEATMFANSNLTKEQINSSIERLPAEQQDLVRKQYEVANANRIAQGKAVIGAGYAEQQKYVLEAPVADLSVYRAPIGLPDNVSSSLEALARQRVFEQSGSKIATNWSDYAKLKQMLPNELGEANLAKYRLNATELKEMIDLQADVLKGGGSSAKYDSVQSDNGMVKNALGYSYVKDTDKEKQTAIGKVSAAFQSEVVDFQQTNGRAPTPKEKQEIVARLAIKVKSGFGEKAVGEYYDPMKDEYSLPKDSKVKVSSEQYNDAYSLLKDNGLVTVSTDRKEQDGMIQKYWDAQATGRSYNAYKPKLRKALIDAGKPVNEDQMKALYLRTIYSSK